MAGGDPGKVLLKLEAGTAHSSSGTADAASAGSEQRNGERPPLDDLAGSRQQREQQRARERNEGDESQDV